MKKNIYICNRCLKQFKPHKHLNHIPFHAKLAVTFYDFTRHVELNEDMCPSCVKQFKKIYKDFMNYKKK